MQTATLGVLLGLSLATVAQAAPVSPVAIYRQALNVNPRYLAAIDNRQAEEAGRDVARSRLLPRLSLSSSLARNHAQNSVGSSDSRYHYDNSSTALRLSVPVYNRYDWARLKQSNSQLALADTQLGATGNDLFLKICRAYFDVLLSADRLRFIQAQQDSIRSQKAAAQKKFEAGAGTRIDIDDAVAREQGSIADEIEARAQLAAQQATLASLAGQPVSELRRLQDVDADSLLRQSLPRWEQQAMAANSDLVSLRQQIDIAGQEIEKARAGHYPTVDLFASSSRAQNDSVYSLSNKNDNIYRVRSVGLQLDVPLYSGGGVVAGVRQAQEKREQAEHLYQAAQDELRLQLGSVYRDIDTGNARVKALALAEKAALQTVLSNRRGVDAGAKTTVDVLLAEELLYRTRLQRAAAHYNLALSAIQLRLLAGTLGEDELAYVDSLFVYQP